MSAMEPDEGAGTDTPRRDKTDDADDADDGEGDDSSGS
jgi:hypothetical protein